MKYLGSKNKISKSILKLILCDRKVNQYYVEPFLGGANSMSNVTGNRIGGEFNCYIAKMWVALIEGWQPKYITKNEYIEIKNNKDFFSPYLVGWVGVACSYSGKWFGGYAGVVKTKNGVRNYQNEAFKNLSVQLPKLKGLRVSFSSYENLIFPKKSIIYCDPPYNNTTGYTNFFDSFEFWKWCRIKTKEGNKVFISEYNAPDDFKCIWKQTVKSSLSANGKSGFSKQSVEKLFIYDV